MTLSKNNYEEEAEKSEFNRFKAYYIKSEGGAGMGLFTPPWQNSQKIEKAMRIIRKTTSQKLLFKIATETFYSAVAKEAVCRITDQLLLIAIAKEDVIFDIRILAIDKITDYNTAQEMYADLVIRASGNANSRNVDAIAVTLDKVSDQTQLYNIATKAQDYRICIDAAGKLTDASLAQSVYRDIAENCTLEVGARIDAAEKLTDTSLAQSVYRDMAENCTLEVRTRIMLTDKLTDKSLAQSIYLEIAEGANAQYDRLVAVDKLADRRRAQSIYVKIFRENHNSATLQESAFQRLKNRSLLRGIAKDREIELGYRIRAAERLNDGGLLRDIAEDKAISYSNRLTAAKILKNQDLIQRVYIEIACDESEYYYYRDKALDKITDQNGLSEIAMKRFNNINKDRVLLQKKAIERLNDQCLLNNIVHGGPEFLFQYEDQFEVGTWISYNTWNGSAAEWPTYETRTVTVDLRDIARERLAKL